MRSFIKNIAVALPDYNYTTAQIGEAASKWLGDNRDELELFNRFIRQAKIGSRRFAIELEKILTLGGQEERAKLFLDLATPLALAASHLALKELDMTPAAIDGLLTTSCSVPVIPSIDTLMIERGGYRRDVVRVPLYQHGCAGGAAGLGIGKKLIGPCKNVMITAVELCSLIYQSEDLSAGNLVGSALFGDGAASLIIGSDSGPLEVLASQSYLLNDSYHLMGYDIKDDGAHLRLDRELPSALLRDSPEIVERFLAANNVKIADVKHWLFHPGGVKILEAFDRTFSLSRDRSRWAWEVLDTYGNMSSASILFVIDRFMRSDVALSGELALVVGIGPGITLELSLLRVA